MARPVTPSPTTRSPASLLDDIVRRNLRLAAARLKDGAASDAFAMYAMLSGFQPTNIRALRGLALASIRAKRRADAVTFLSALQKSQPRNIDLLETLLALTGLDSSENNQARYGQTALQMACLRPHVSRPSRSDTRLKVLVLNSLVKGQYQFNARSRAFGISAGHNNLGTLFDREAISVEVLTVDPLVINPDLIAPVLDKLPKVDAVYCAIAAADRAQAELEVADRIARAIGVPMINAPSAIIKTRREAVYEQLRDAPGLIAVNARFVSPADAAAFSQPAWRKREGIATPFIVRSAGYQGGRHMHAVMSDAEAVPSLPANRGLYVIAFHDVSVADGADTSLRLFPKYRAFWVGGELIPIHLFVADDFNVHKKNADPVMATRPWVFEWQADFIENPEGHFAAGRWQQLKAGMQRLGLDYVGVDFAPSTVPGDDRLVIFEANPAMRNWMARLPESDPIQRQWVKVTQAAHRMLCARTARAEWPFTLARGGAAQPGDKRVDDDAAGDDAGLPDAIA